MELNFSDSTLPILQFSDTYTIQEPTVMAIHHATSGERVEVRPLRERLSAEITKTLYKSEHLEVIRVVLAAGKELPWHHVPAESTVQCIEGCLELVVGNETVHLRAGELICLAGGEDHAFKAIQDCSVLRTLVLHVS